MNDLLSPLAVTCKCGEDSIEHLEAGEVERDGDAVTRGQTHASQASAMRESRMVLLL